MPGVLTRLEVDCMYITDKRGEGGVQRPHLINSLAKYFRECLHPVFQKPTILFQAGEWQILSEPKRN